jgi:predicted DCC family thiol-disulfide oxidoreductase YuxK
VTRRRWTPLPATDVPDGLILFDGVCLLCAWWVRFVIARDRPGHFRFAPIQQPFGERLARKFGIDTAVPETNAVVAEGRAYFKSDSAIRVLRELPGWRWVGVLSVLPREFRDWVYDRVARNRYQVFGRTEQCMVPTPDVLARFIFDER